MSVVQFVLFLALVFISSGFLCKLLYEYSFNLGGRNLKDDEIRWQARKPSLGGLNFIFVFLFFSIGCILLDSSIDIKNSPILKCLLIGSIVSFIVGFIDDVRNTNPLLKLLGQIICGFILVGFDIIIPLSPNVYWNSLLTIFWIVFLMNSINMIDNIDGLASSIAMIILMAMVGYIFLFNRVDFQLIIIFILIILGALSGFLLFNWHPSKIYMGDSGSQFLGFMVGVFSVYIIWGVRTAEGGYFQLNQLTLPLYFFAVPIFDTATVFIHRIWRKQSPFVGGRDHLSHLFSMKTGSDSTSVLILIALQVFFCIVGLASYRHPISNMYALLLGMFILSFLSIQWIYIQNKQELLKP